MKSLKPPFFILLLSALPFLYSCSSDSSKEKEEINTENVEIIRFDKELMAVKSTEELTALLNKYPFYSRMLYRAFPEDTAFVNHIFYITQHPDTRKLYSETGSSFGDMGDLKKEFARAFTNIKKDYPDFKEPKIYTTFTGLENDLFVSDSLIIISLEAFLGPKATYRPDQPAYILSRYDKPYIVPSVIRLLSDRFIRGNQESALLNDMIYFGKSFEFTKEMLPDVPDSLIICLPDSSLKSNWYAQDLIWAHFIDKSLLYEQNPKTKEKYIGERPKVPEVGPSCPGRIGQWLGWRIVDKFRTENPDVSFVDLMNITDYQDILKRSKYRGEVEE